MDMDDRLAVLIQKIKLLEAEMLEELGKKQKEFLYEVAKKRVRFQETAVAAHKKFLKHVPRYLLDASLRNILTAPIIWSIIFPALLIDVTVSLFQAICFPAYGIPKVKRSDYIVMDRHYLKYLNLIEKANCYYCGYFNGLLLYIEEIAARTEQYWCPIKHARKIKDTHSRYRKFLDYGDAEAYATRLEKVRGDFDDLKPKSKGVRPVPEAK